MSDTPAKQCTGCGIEKPLDAFYIERRRGAPEPRCKACRRALASAYYHAHAREVYVSACARRFRNRDEYRRRQQLWYLNNYEKARAYRKQWRDNRREQLREQSRQRYRATPPDVHRARNQRYRDADKQRRRAHVAVTNAVRRGKLIRQACERCGDQKTQAHHRDYSKPLDVQWLCASCHRAVHGGKAPRFKTGPFRTGASPGVRIEVEVME